ncbi:MAG: preprotein translocase subunit SecG [Candidatus Pacebacteria bacterium]|nr:preprotein translocase subunit SecG [Candidatus Paceibacterota bacterium]
MVAFLSILPFAQIALAILLIVGVLLQERSAGIGGALGGGDGSITYHKRRGFEKFLFVFSIVVAILFVAVTIVHIALR